MTADALFDQQHLWHPYAPADGIPCPIVREAKGVRLTLTDGTELIDGMSSWWCMIHGYRHPAIAAAVEAQLHRLPHVMFGGLTHEPAIELGRLLLELVPDNLTRIFYADSGSVSVEVAMKMALQYQHALGEHTRVQFAALRGGYHGDTWHPMSVCDPETGMHKLYRGRLPIQHFLPRPQSRFDGKLLPADCAALENFFHTHGKTTAAFIIEPIAQGAGGMWFYHPDYLRRLAELCREHGVLLIADEIATGFGRTGELFGVCHADVAPDIMCLGKALTGGTMSFAAVLCTEAAAQTISRGEARVLMHGPTFMANPLACAAAIASLRLIQQGQWREQTAQIARILREELRAAIPQDYAADVRILGAIGVIETKAAIDIARITPMFLDAGIWVRPFGKLVYLMPPFIISDADLRTLCRQLLAVLDNYFHG